MGEISEAAELKLIGPDHLAEVRYVHAAAFRAQGRPQFSDQQVEAFAAYVYSRGYTSALSEASRGGCLVGAWLGPELIGTVGWSPADGLGILARIRWVFVRPMFTGLGVGTKLVEDIERRVRQAGFRTLVAEVPINVVEFFTRLGYQVSSQGLRALADVEGLPVAFLRKAAQATAPSASGGVQPWH
jgi:GNAT superfamily N-acetyltransferase